MKRSSSWRIIEIKIKRRSFCVSQLRAASALAISACPGNKEYRRGIGQTWLGAAVGAVPRL